MVTDTSDKLITGVKDTFDNYDNPFYVIMIVKVTPDTFIVGVNNTSDKFTTSVNNFGHKFIVSVNDNVDINNISKSAIYNRCQQYGQ